MHSIKIHKVIGLIIAFLYLTGLWHRGVKPTAREFKVKLFYCIYYFMVVVSFAVGAITNDKYDQKIFLTEGSITLTVYAIKFWILIWKQDEILDLLHRICEFSIRNEDAYDAFNEKMGKFIKFVVAYVVYLLVFCYIENVAVPICDNEKILFFEIAFPLNWRDNELAFWIANFFLFTETLLTIVVMFFSIIIWYLLLNCSLRYEVLGCDIRNMGRIDEKRGGVVTILAAQHMHNEYFEDLKISINAHKHLRGLVNDLGTFCADIFFIQFGTSALCICGSVYCLAFDVGDTLLEQFMFFVLLTFSIVELFSITYFGNEIMLSSDRLSYSLFESDWYEQPQAIKKCIIVFGEYLKQPQELIIGKLYPLTLATFTRILNSAYNMFNILKSFHQ